MPKRNTPGPGTSYSNFRKIEDKENVLNEARRRKHLTYREAKITMTCDIFSEAMQAGREWSEISEMLREETHLFTLIILLT